MYAYGLVHLGHWLDDWVSLALCPLGITDQVGTLCGDLLSFYRSQWDEAAGRVRMPIMVFCTMANFATALHAARITR